MAHDCVVSLRLNVEIFLCKAMSGGGLFRREIAMEAEPQEEN